MTPLPKVKLFLLGGTITMEKPPEKTGAVSKGVVPTANAEALCRAVPGLSHVAEVDARTDQMIASGNLTYDHAFGLVEEIKAAASTGDVAGFVVVQGTDTLEEMAFLLDCLLDIAQPVVVTGALRSASAPGADGPANILAAVTCAVHSPISSAGVVVVMNDEIHSARFVCKSHTGSLGAFTSPNSGPIGRVSEGQVHLFAVPPCRPVMNIPENRALPHIVLLKASFGDEGELLPMLQAADLPGLVVEGFGAGHVPEAYLQSLTEMAKGRPVILASRTGAGSVFRQTYGYPGAEMDLIARGLIPAGLLDGLKAKILLTLLVMSGATVEDIYAAFTE